MKTIWRICLALIAILSQIVICQSINPSHSVCSVVSDAGTINLDDEYVSDKFRINNDEEVNTPFPLQGTGLYRDPSSVLGPKFLPSVTINLCEVQLHEHANEISSIKFTTIGNKTCLDVCIQYRINMRLNNPVNVAL